MAETKLLQRVFYALQMAWKYRRKLRCYLSDPQLQIKSVTELTLEYLQKLQIKVLVLDFDGVLGADHALLPASFVKPWLDQVYQHYQDKLFILSNKPLAPREANLKACYPKLNFVKGVAKKPYPEGLLLIQNQTQVDKDQMLFCDDRLLTGVLAAELAQIKVLWLTQPIQDFKKRFWHELFFASLRRMDRGFLWLLGH